MKTALSGHQSASMKTDTWLTPPEIIRKLGPFDLDPCCPPVMPWRTAEFMWSIDGRPPHTIQADGLLNPWKGRVWLNPPFGNRAICWLEKMALHGDGVALIPARTETKMFRQYVWSAADAVCFLDGRPHFYHPDGTRAKFNSGAPICLVAYGSQNASALASSGLGTVVEWRVTK